MNEELIPVGTVLRMSFNPELDETFWEVEIPGDDGIMVFNTLEDINRFFIKLNNVIKIR